MKYTIILSNEEVKALEHIIPSIQEWIEHAIKNKARRCIDRIIEQMTDKQPKKISEETKLGLIKNMKLETRITNDEEVK